MKAKKEDTEPTVCNRIVLFALDHCDLIVIIALIVAVIVGAHFYWGKG